jgi:hypothetical protein
MSRSGSIAIRFEEARFMAIAALEACAALADADVPSSLRVLVLARAGADAGATRSELARGLAPFVSHKLSPAAWRSALDRTLRALENEELIEWDRGRAALAGKGRTAVSRLFGASGLPAAWDDIRDTRLVAIALGLEAEAAVRLQALARPDGLRAAILQKAYDLNIKGPPSPRRLRSALAVVALERAFGGNIKAGLGAGTGLAAKVGRLIAGQLSRRPRDFGTDSRLIAALAAEQVGAAQTDADTLRTAILRNFVSRSFAAPLPSSWDKCASASASASASAVAPPPSAPQGSSSAAPQDLAGFAREVNSAARTRAAGWPGNSKAFISHVWQTLQVRCAEWGLTELEFKAMLAKAHRMGHVTLSSADLKDKRDIKELQESAVVYKNTVWHFVRVED